MIKDTPIKKDKPVKKHKPVKSTKTLDRGCIRIISGNNVVSFD